MQSYDRLSDFQRTAPRLCTVDGTFFVPEIEFWLAEIELLNALPGGVRFRLENRGGWVKVVRYLWTWPRQK